VSEHNNAASRPVRVRDLQAMKAKGQKICVLTAYDAPMAHLLDRAGIDVILVGDSLGMVVLGYETTIPVTLDMMIHHTQAVSRGARRPLIVADMPFLTYQISVEEAVRNAGRLVQEGGASAVKLEGGRHVLHVVERLAEVGIPVMGHLGLTPQSIHALSGFRMQARDEASAEQLLSDARALEKAGAFSLVLESIPAAVAREVTSSVQIPTIGIGAGPHCDGQVLVSSDMFGILDRPAPSFARQYAHVHEILIEAARAYIEDVRGGRFPGS